MKPNYFNAIQSRKRGIHPIKYKFYSKKLWQNIYSYSILVIEIVIQITCLFELWKQKFKKSSFHFSLNQILACFFVKRCHNNEKWVLLQLECSLRQHRKPMGNKSLLLGCHNTTPDRCNICTSYLHISIELWCTWLWCLRCLCIRCIRFATSRYHSTDDARFWVLGSSFVYYASF